jgi:hypothetical protein
MHRISQLEDEIERYKRALEWMTNNSVTLFNEEGFIYANVGLKLEGSPTPLEAIEKSMEESK